MKTKFYSLADRPTLKEYKALGYESINEMHLALARQEIRAISRGEVRPPRKGEWFLSGAEVQAYRAIDDPKIPAMTTPYTIAALVRVSVETIETITKQL